MSKKTNIKSISEENAIMRIKILEFLYLVNQENKKTNWDGTSNKLNVEKNKLKPNLKFLKDKNLIGYPQNINGDPVSAWGPKGGIFITSDGVELIEEINGKRKEGIKKFTEWATKNASWVVPAISYIIKHVILGEI